MNTQAQQLTNWNFIGVSRGSGKTYAIWYEPALKIYNVTDSIDVEPATDGGYPNLKALLKLKGVKI